MLPEPIQKLVDQFKKLPSIGSRQATRFAFFLLRQNKEDLKQFASAIEELQAETAICPICFRVYKKHHKNRICQICSSPKRNHSIITVVESDVNLASIEKTKLYRGAYHVLGGTISPLDGKSPKDLHLKELFQRIRSSHTEKNKIPVKEVILATNPTTEGDSTALYVQRVLKPLQTAKNAKPLNITMLARGLSKGNDLEYIDEDTIKNSIQRRIPYNS